MEKLQSSKVLRKQMHGRCIYAYCHINTNQVVYSLTQNLHNHSTLKQLPDLGANNKPTALRKDLWRPFFTVILPDSASGAAQGLHAYKKLLEWRTLHETSWTPSPLLSRPYTQDQIDEIKQRLEDRGGSKTESAYDVIRREKKKMRIREVRDQKANSVADLATVLIDQEVMGSKLVEEREQEQEKKNEQELKEFLELYDASERGDISVLDHQISKITKHAEQLEKDGPQDSLAAVRKEIQELRRRRNRLQFVADTVSRVKKEQQLQMEAQAAKESPGIATATPVPTELTEEQRLKAARKARDKESNQLKKRLQELQPLFPPPKTLRIRRIPKRGHLRAELRRAARPVFTTKGVRVSWQNMLDAEFAAEWPEDVEHSAMGFTRHTAPKAGSEPMLKVLDAEAAKEHKRPEHDAWRQRRDARKAQIWKDGGDRTPELERIFKRKIGRVQSALMQTASDAFEQKRRERRKGRDKAASEESM